MPCHILYMCNHVELVCAVKWCGDIFCAFVAGQAPKRRCLIRQHHCLTKRCSSSSSNRDEEEGFYYICISMAPAAVDLDCKKQHVELHAVHDSQGTGKLYFKRLCPIFTSTGTTHTIISVKKLGMGSRHFTGLVYHKGQIRVQRANK